MSAPLFDLTPSKRRAAVIMALEFTLQDLERPSDTRTVVDLLQKRLNVPADDTMKLARLVSEVAPLFPEAQRSTATAGRYGKTWHPWIWSPRGTRPPVEVARSSPTPRPPGTGRTVEELQADNMALRRQLLTLQGVDLDALKDRDLPELEPWES